MTGKLRQKVTVQSATQNSDGQGGSYEAWTTDKTVFAHVERTTGAKQTSYNQIYEGEIYEVICRYDSVSDVKQGDNRFVYDGRNLTIHESSRVKPETTRRQQTDRYLKFICSVKNG